MHQNILNLQKIEKQINSKNANNESKTKIIAVSKTFAISDIKPLIDYGHIHFGENKIQEALNKWPEILKKHKNLKLHMIGRLQTNKVKQAVGLFDFIHSVDTIKLAEKISSEQKKINKNISLFIQINIGNETQKSGIPIDELENFYKYLSNILQLNVVGLMCIPPIKMSPNEVFKKMNELNRKIGFKELSIVMSSDYIEAINHGATFVRIGSKIFGQRKR